MLRRGFAISALGLFATASAWAAPVKPAVLRRIAAFEGGIRIELSRRVEPVVTTLLNPSRLALDFDGTLHAGASRHRSARGGVFSAVRSSQFIGGVAPVARVVLDLDANAAHRLFWNGPHLTVLLERDFETDLRDALAPLAPAVFRSRPAPGRPPPARGVVRRYRGFLKNREGTPMTGAYLLRFTARDWSEAVYVKSSAGKFTARLGMHRALPERYREAPLDVSVRGPAGTGWTVLPR